MADMYGGGSSGGDYNEELNKHRKPSLFIGNLTWWTTDQDVIDSLQSIGVNDVQEIKFFENRGNGQSKGFCSVTFGSESSLPIVMDKMPKLSMHGQNPMITPYNRQNLNLFESQTTVKVRPQQNNSITNSGPRGGGGYNQSHVRAPLGGGPSLRSPMLPRPPVMLHGGPGMGRMPMQQHVYMPMGGQPHSLAVMQQQSQQPLPQQQQQQQQIPLHQQHQQHQADIPQQYFTSEYDEIMNKNREVSKMAIDRALYDSGEGRHLQGIETLVTAINLIENSKVGNSERTQFLISTLQTTLESIENKLKRKPSSIGRNRSRSRSKSKERSRDKDRDRDRERDRNRGDRDRNRDREKDSHRARDRDRDRSERGDRDDREHKSSREDRRSSKRDKERSSKRDRKDR